MGGPSGCCSQNERGIVFEGKDGWMPPPPRAGGVWTDHSSTVSTHLHHCARTKLFIFLLSSSSTHPILSAGSSCNQWDESWQQCVSRPSKLGPDLFLSESPADNLLIITIVLNINAPINQRHKCQTMMVIMADDEALPDFKLVSGEATKHTIERRLQRTLYCFDVVSDSCRPKQNYLFLCHSS